MMDFLYMWIRNISVYLILASAALQIVPGKDYKKYIRFFSGLVFLLLLFLPVLKVTGMDETFYDIYSNSEYEREKQEIERASELYENSEIEELIGSMENNIEDNKSDRGIIEVEEIRINE